MEAEHLFVILTRVTRKLISASGHPLVESIKPPQTTTVCRVNEKRIDQLRNRRVPAKTNVPTVKLMHVHSTGWHHRETQLAVVDLYYIHSSLLASPESIFPY